MTENNTQQENKPSVGIRPWGTTPKTNRKFDDDLPLLPFMNMKKGLNTVRVLTGIGDYYQVKWKGPKSQRPYGDRIRTSYPTYENCPVKEYLGLEGKKRHKVIVIDRADGELKILDLSVLTAEQIETNLEVKNARRGPENKVTPKDFDISIKFSPDSTTPAGFYSVVADDVIPLSAEDLAMIEDVGGYEVLEKVLNRQLLCPRPEKVIEKLKSLGWDGEKVQKEEAKTETLEEPDEDDYSFNPPTEEKQAVNE